MEVFFHRNFVKQYKKLPEKVQIQFIERLQIFQTDGAIRMLHIHTLRGEFSMYTSMNVNSDVRALYVQSGDTVTFEKIGTHSELYG